MELLGSEAKSASEVLSKFSILVLAPGARPVDICVVFVAAVCFATCFPRQGRAAPPPREGEVHVAADAGDAPLTEAAVVSAAVAQEERYG